MTHFGPDWLADFIVGVVWTVVAAVFVFARLFTRYWLGPDRLGYDDWVLLAALIFRVVRQVFCSISWYPLFQGMTSLEAYMDPPTFYLSHKYLNVGLWFSYLDQALAQGSIALFLVRLAVVRWHKVLLWTLFITLVAFSVAVGSVLMWAGLVWRLGDPWPVNYKAVMIAIFSYELFIMVFLAAFPWYMFWNVRMERSKKLVICISLSLALVSAGTSIGRLITIWSLDTEAGVVAFDIWSNFTTGFFFIFVSIPALIPLWYIIRNHGRRRAPTVAAAGPARADENNKRNVKGDSVIHDPRAAALLVETEPSQRRKDLESGTGTSSTATRGLSTLASVDEEKERSRGGSA